MDFEEGNEILSDNEKEPLSKDDILRGKYIERNFEKILKILKEPRKTDNKDYFIIGLLIIVIAIILFKPSGGGGVVIENQRETQKKLDALSSKVDNLEKQLLTIAGIEENANLSGNQTKKEETLKKLSETKKDEITNTSKESLSAKNDKEQTDSTALKEEKHFLAKNYKVKSGDTLSIICERYYKSNDPELIKGLGRYNNLKSPNFDLFPGNTLKIPPKSSLVGVKKHKKS